MEAGITDDDLMEHISWGKRVRKATFQRYMKHYETLKRDLQPSKASIESREKCACFGFGVIALCLPSSHLQ